MARIRSIKPEFWVSEQIAECSPNARLTFVGLWNFSDDNGVHPAKPKTLKAELYPMDDCTAADVAAWVGELLRAGLLAKFTGPDGLEYWHVTGWKRHQKIDRPSFKYPVPPTADGASFDECSPTSIDEDSSNQIDEDSSSDRRAPPPGVERKDRKGGSASPKARRAPAKTAAPKTQLPADFSISDRVRGWAAEKGFGDLDRHLEAFIGKARAKGYAYADWDEAFMGAIRDDWARVRSGGARDHSGPLNGADPYAGAV